MDLRVNSTMAIADDWEIQEPTVTITRAQLTDAILAYIAVERRDSFFFAGTTVYPDPVKFIADKLGLEETK